MNDPPSHPLWRNERWIAVAALSLLAWYPLSVGPYVYLRERGWLRGPKVGYLWDPIPVVFGLSPYGGYRPEQAPWLFRCWHDYGRFFREAGARHREADKLTHAK